MDSERERERGGGGRGCMVCASCRIHSPASRRRWGESGRGHGYLGQLPWPRWEWLTLVTTVNAARQASMKRPEWPWSDRIASNKRRSNDTPPGKRGNHDAWIEDDAFHSFSSPVSFSWTDNNYGGWRWEEGEFSIDVLSINIQTTKREWHRFG